VRDEGLYEYKDTEEATEHIGFESGESSFGTPAYELVIE
jgi:hypothetical protein